MHKDIWEATHDELLNWARDPEFAACMKTMDVYIVGHVPRKTLTISCIKAGSCNVKLLVVWYSRQQMTHT